MRQPNLFHRMTTKNLFYLHYLTKRQQKFCRKFGQIKA
uniref:Uncharacterized protein n=1 Tax=Romanomermis culicivorax TaxID=13658 RepID=A0A915HJ74_ROMCU